MNFDSFDPWKLDNFDSWKRNDDFTKMPSIPSYEPKKPENDSVFNYMEIPTIPSSPETRVVPIFESYKSPTPFWDAYTGETNYSNY